MSSLISNLECEILEKLIKEKMIDQKLTEDSKDLIMRFVWSNYDQFKMKKISSIDSISYYLSIFQGILFSIYILSPFFFFLYNKKIFFISIIMIQNFFYIQHNDDSKIFFYDDSKFFFIYNMMMIHN